MQWWIPIAVFVAAASASRKASAKETDDGKRVPMDQKRRALRCAIATAGMGDDWLRFLEVTAYRESRFNPGAWNDSAGEVKASERAVDRIRDRLEDLDVPPDDWAYGSKGLFQFLGPYVIAKGQGWRFPPEMADPDMAFDPGVAVAAAFGFARGLMQFGSFADTWASLRVGWGLPSAMSDPQRLRQKGEEMENRAAALGWPRGWANDRPTPLPKRDPGEMADLAAVAAAAYEACEVG